MSRHNIPTNNSTSTTAPTVTPPSTRDDLRRKASVRSMRRIKNSVSSASKSMIRRYIFVLTSSLL